MTLPENAPRGLPSQLVPLPDLAGLAELAAELGVAIPTIHSWRRRYADFPHPIVTLHATPIWRVSAVRQWMARHPRKPGRPRKVAP